MCNYREMRKPFIPDKVRLLLVGESPPRSDEECKYFYNTERIGNEQLFDATTEAILGQRYEDKGKGLNKLKKKGILLIDVVYEPVNHLDRKERKEKVRKNYERVISEIEKYAEKETPIVLVGKAMVCPLGKRLKKNGYSDIHCLPFPVNKKNCKENGKGVKCREIYVRELRQIWESIISFTK